ncbi:HTTM domain-containing protein [Leucobacter viscericola]|uniref:HTTM domain-containing protein n=1 Tax=Leucobacter viscericola TaxID=2714935 RepID=A0A6G7XH58_9MICO|nr:HTTM domain-containing protein [Leucobacter viscericola]QIK63895.1 HTTM domain-containing protein [Leucobacter viscericola]
MSAQQPTTDPTPGVGAGLKRLLVGVFRDGWKNLVAQLTLLRDFFEHWLMDAPKARYGIAVTRMLFSFAAIGILLTNFNTRFYAFGTGSAWSSELDKPISDFPNIWLFSFFYRIIENDTLFTIAYILLGVLAFILMIGYRTKIVMPIFFVGWVSFIELNDMLGDQGDNIFRIVMLVLMFADTSSRWSLDAKRRKKYALNPTNSFVGRALRGGPLVPSWFRNLFHNVAIMILVCQVSMVYVSGAFYKASGEPWDDGIALYAPITTQQFGTWPELSAFFTSWGPVVAGLTYMTLLIQAFFPAMLMNKWTRRLALLVIVVFHLGIALLMGLPWFSLCMIGIDSVFIRDVSWQRLSLWITSTYRGKTTPATTTSLMQGQPA